MGSADQECREYIVCFRYWDGRKDPRHWYFLHFRCVEDAWREREVHDPVLVPPEDLEEGVCKICGVPLLESEVRESS